MNKERMRHTALVALILVLAVLCGIKIAGRRARLREYEEMQAAAASAAAETEAYVPVAEGVPETEAPAPRDEYAERVIDFASLKKRNEDVVAWIFIPDTVIDYPVLYKRGDNEYYLHRDIDRASSYNGIYLDADDEPDMSCWQNVFYGHHMKNGSMFTAICSFKDEAFFREHQRVYLYTPDHTYILKPLACLYTDASAEKRRVKFEDRLEFSAYAEKMTRGCSFRELPEGGIDRLFSFVTCSYEFNNARTILYCSEVDAGGVPVAPAETLKKEGSTES